MFGVRASAQRFTTTMALTLVAMFVAVAPIHAGADRPGRVISTVLVDLRRTGHKVRAVLVAGTGDLADLQLFFDSAPGNPGTAVRPALVVEGVAYHDDIPGRGAFLEAKPNGALLIKSGNSSVGRNRWTENLTVIFRDNKLIVAGITLSKWDTLEAGSEHTCDLNLLTGKGLLDSKPIDANLSPFMLSEWRDMPKPEVCHFEQY